MKSFMQDIQARFKRFMNSPYTSSLLVLCEPEDSPLLLKSLEALEQDPAVLDIFLTFGHAFEYFDGYVKQILDSIRQQLAQVNEALKQRGDSALAPFPSELEDKALLPATQLCEAMQYVRSIVPRDRRIAYILYPLEIDQPAQYLQLIDYVREQTEAINRVNKALEEQRYADAEKEAETALRLFDDPQMRQLFHKAKTRRLVEEAKDFLAAKEVDKAREKNEEALRLTATDQEAQTIQKEINHILSKRKTLFLLKIAFASLLGAGMLTGLYFLLRTREWLLEGVHGPCQEKTFLLDKDEIKIGALGPPHGECDTVIRDHGHRISPLHCLMVRNGRHWYLINESTNGTMVNDEEVEKGDMVRLRKGDRLSLADEAVLVLRPN